MVSRDNFSITLAVSAGVPPLQSLLPEPAEAETLQPVSLAVEALETLKFAVCTPQDCA